jgi:hypothetical protein
VHGQSPEDGDIAARLPRGRARRASTLAPMKKLTTLVLVATLATGCYGSYGAFHAVHRWNGHATDNKVANSAIHLGFWILPVYPLCLLGDFLIFNNVEFISGQPVFH